MAPYRGKIWTALDPEFGNDASKSAIIVKALYGLKSGGASFRAHHVHWMWELEYESHKTNPDLLWKPETRPQDKLEYYSYIPHYVDDIKCIHHDPDDALNKLNCYVPLKSVSVGSTNMYLGTKLNLMQLHNGIWAWSMSPSNYIHEPIRICKYYVAKYLSKGYIHSL